MNAEADPAAAASEPAGSDAAVAPQSTDAGAQSSSGAKLRKRTKTGCLTCRRRRIKCGEERPICTNCVRSKRPCEGYNQRLVFKTTTEGWPGMIGPANIIPHHTSMLPGGQRSEYPVNYTYVEQQTHYGIPIDEFGRPLRSADQQGVSPGWPSVNFSQASMAPPGPSISPAPFGSIPPTPTSLAPSIQAGYIPPNFPLQSPQPLLSPFYQENTFLSSFDGISPQAHQLSSQADNASQYSQASAMSMSTASYGGAMPIYPTPSVMQEPGYFALQRNQATSQAAQTPISAPSPFEPNSRPTFGHKPGISRNFTGAPIAVELLTRPTSTQYVIDASRYDLQTAAVEWQHEEYDSPWDSDEDDETTAQQLANFAQHNYDSLKMIVAVSGNYSINSEERDYKSFLYDGFLAEYDAEKFASPLRNPHTARVFAHFLQNTAATISIFERSSAHLHLGIGDERDRGIWSYTLPVMALRHQGLLHAMLSLSSLHISKLQNDAPTPAFKHYGYAIKRINRCVQHSGKRHNLTTLAATLLLGFYEVMTADHTKWCCHLSGAARLLQEIDFAGMAAQASILHQDQITAYQSGGMQSAGAAFSDIDVIDSKLVNIIIGPQVVRRRSPGVPVAPLDLSKYRTYQDMFWWYARQDVYQSIIAGNRLMLKYHRWSDCPPRAAMGRSDAIYGSHDHLFLMLGRIADYSSKDRERKLKVMSMTGGAWRPHPDMKMPARPSGRPSPPDQQGQEPHTRRAGQPGSTINTPRGPPASAPATPNFYGLAPMPTRISLPKSYSTNSTVPPLESPVSEKNAESLETQTKAAVAEWTQIYGALQELRHHFGPGFAPLESSQLHLASPFGPPVLYASPGIAVLWALYNAAHIIALRAHPYMPPFAHVAAGVAAMQTKEFSNTIGRIAAGMMTGPINQSLDPVIGAYFCEICMPLFIAGIQYQDAAQRQWLVARTREIETLTGWASIGMIGQGCERAWVKTAEAGMGPPYIPPPEQAVRAHDSLTMRVPRVGHGRPTSTSEHWAQHPRDQDPRGMRVHLAMGLLSNESDLHAEEQALRHEQQLSRAEHVHAAASSSAGPSSSSLAFRLAA